MYLFSANPVMPLLALLVISQLPAETARNPDQFYQQTFVKFMVGRKKSEVRAIG